MFRFLVTILTAGLAAVELSASAVSAGAAAPLATHATSPWVGAYTGCYGECTTDPATLWKDKNRLIGGGKLSYSRDFNPKIPAVGKEAWREVPSPYHFYSVKPTNGDVEGFLVGRYDDALKAVIKELPAGTKVTMRLIHARHDGLPSACRIGRRTEFREN